jgi:hypothetical protein
MSWQEKLLAAGMTRCCATSSLRQKKFCSRPPDLLTADPRSAVAHDDLQHDLYDASPHSLNGGDTRSVGCWVSRRGQPPLPSSKSPCAHAALNSVLLMLPSRFKSKRFIASSLAVLAFSTKHRHDTWQSKPRHSADRRHSGTPQKAVERATGAAISCPRFSS